MNKYLKGISLLGTITFLVASSYAADVLNGVATCDNLYQAYLSTSSTALGVQIGSGSSWGTATALSATSLANGQSYYLNIACTDLGPPAGFLGSFNLSGTGHFFVNGTQNLVTNTTDWSGSATSIGGPATTLYDEGVNGVAPWGHFNSIDSSAHWIWGAYGTSTVFLQTKITAVPEPAPLVILGLAVVGLLVRRVR